MKNKLPNVTLLALFITVSTNSYADLSSPVYLKAKESYEESGCAESPSLLKEYMESDELFLNSNPEIKRKIETVLEYCDAVGPIFTVTGAKGSLPQLP